MSGITDACIHTYSKQNRCILNKTSSNYNIIALLACFVRLLCLLIFNKLQVTNFIIVKISIPEKYADLYIKALEEKKKGLLDKIGQFKREIIDIDSHINSLTSMSIFGDTVEGQSANWKTNEYSPQWAWTRKITYYQEYKRKLITTSEVVDFIIGKEPELNKSKVRSSVSAALSNRLKSNTYEKFKDPVTGASYYGPASYFLNPHEPKIEFMSEDLKERLLYNK